MDLSREYEPIQPSGDLPASLQLLRTQWLAAPLRLKVLLTVYLTIGAWGGLAGGHFLTSAYSNWITWSVTLLILEPIGVASMAALIFLYWPNSWIGRHLDKALRRAKVAILIIAAFVFGWIAWVIVYIGIEFWRLQ